MKSVNEPRFWITSSSNGVGVRTAREAAAHNNTFSVAFHDRRALGISDTPDETYEFAPETTTPGPHMVVVRAMDLLGNVASARVEIP